jgi:PKD repeat protein
MFVWTGAPAPAPNTAPASAFTNSCSGATCDFDGSGSTDIDGTIVSYSWSFGDGQNGTGAATTRTYATSGTYNVTLTVTDDDGATGVVIHQVNVVVPPNQPPTASFTSSCLDLSCTFDGSAGYDPDGTITAYSWDFGDGQSGTGVSPAHAYATAATYSVTLTVTDNRGATATSSAPVSVTAPPVEFREAASFNGNAVSPAVTIPGNVAAGDGLVLIVTANKDTTTTTPTGWTLFGTESDGTPDMRSWAFARSASAGLGGTTVSVTLGTQSKVSMVLLAYSGANPGVVSATASAAEPANTASHATPPVSVAADGSFVVSYWADKTPGNAGWTLPAEVTERLQSLGSGTGQITAVVGDSGPMGVGAWSGVTATSSVGSGKAIGWSIVIAPV